MLLRRLIFDHILKNYLNLEWLPYIFNNYYKKLLLLKKYKLTKKVYFVLIKLLTSDFNSFSSLTYYFHSLIHSSMLFKIKVEFMSFFFIDL